MKRTTQLAAAALFTAAAWSAQATTAVWTSPNSAYVSVTDAATWGGTVPDQPGDIGNVTGRGPIRINMDHSTAWRGTLHVQPVSGGGNLMFSNTGDRTGIGNSTSFHRIRLGGGVAILGTSTQNSDRSLGAAGDVIELVADSSLVLQNSSHDRGWNFWPDVTGSGQTLTVASKRTNNARTIRTMWRGLLSGVGLKLDQAFIETAGSAVLTFGFRGDGSINRIYAVESSTTSRLVIGCDLQIDLSGYDSRAATSQEWQLIDWSNIIPNSGFVGGTVKTGDTEWAHDGAARYYNGARGRVWTHRHQGRTWTFTESTGTLTVSR